MIAEAGSVEELYLRTADVLPEHAGHAITDVEARHLGEVGVMGAAGERLATAWTARRRNALVLAGRVTR